MALDDLLDKGDKVEIHVSLYARELDVIDGLCREYNCSRASVIGAWAKKYVELDLTGEVKAGRRPGGGRPRAVTE